MNSISMPTENFPLKGGGKTRPALILRPIQTVNQSVEIQFCPTHVQKRTVVDCLQSKTGFKNTNFKIAYYGKNRIMTLYLASFET